MAVYEQNVLLTNKDADGNKSLLFPITRLDNVDGAEDLLHYDSAQELTETQQTQVRDNIGAAAAYHEHPVLTSAVTATGDGEAYTATVEGVTALKKGMMITIIPDKTSTATIPSLNVNGLGAKNIKQRLALNTSLTVGAATEAWMIAGKPVPLLFDGIVWVTITGRPAASTLYGMASIENGGTGASTADEARKNLGAARKATVDGETLIL